MAFNLNKNDGPNKGSSSQKQHSSAFNLTKHSATASPPQHARKASFNTNTWIMTSIVALVAVGVIWYYSSSKELSIVQHSAPTAQSEMASAPKRDKFEVKTETPHNVAAGVATLNRKVPVTFAQGSITFRKIDQSVIQQLTAYLKENSEASIQINGYASSEGKLAANQVISQARADAFKRFLVSLNISENRVKAVGKGIEMPIASNETNAGRKRNRRIEVVLP